MTGCSRTQSNPRYKDFCQICYTAGDEEQFRDHVTNTNRRDTRTRARPVPVDLQPLTKIDWYRGRGRASSRDDTFKYLFHNLKKGIFVSIREGKLAVFLPFSKHNFSNSWGANVVPDPEYGSVARLLEESQRRCGRAYNPKRVNLDPSFWVSNGPLVRFERPVREGDSNVCSLKDMFATLCSEREVPDCDFFLNRHDFPRLRQDGGHPHFPLRGEGVEHYSPSHSYLPVLSMCSSPEHADIAIPTYEDWSAVSWGEGKRFSSSYTNREVRDYTAVDPVSWDQKIDKAVFRGASTGSGLTSKDNLRIRLNELAASDSRLDVGITSWNTRPRARRSEGHIILGIPDISDDGRVANSLSPQEQSTYKYVINVEGHSCAFRLSRELSYGSVLLLCPSSNSIWVQKAMKPGVHYLPIARDLSDLSSTLDWCESHQSECRKIADNSRKLHTKTCGKGGILNFLQSLLVKLKTSLGPYSYNEATAMDVLASIEKKNLKEIPIIDGTIRSGEILKKSKTTTLTLVPQGVMKQVVSSKVPELYHGSFVSKILSDHGFSQVSRCIGRAGDNSTIWERVEGDNLFAAIGRQEISTMDLIDITIQVCGVLQTLQEELQFVHNDLYPWNIITQESKEIFRYSTKRGSFVSRGRRKVVLVDFGRSHVVTGGIHHGRIRAFNFSTIRDVVTYIVSVCSALLNDHLEGQTLRLVFDMMSFLSQGEPHYTKQTFNRIKDIRSFTWKAKKYTEMMYSDKGRLEALEPVDLLAHLNIYTPTAGPCPRKAGALHEDSFVNMDNIEKLVMNVDSLSKCDRNTVLTIGGFLMKLNHIRRGDEASRSLLNIIESKKKIS